MTAWFGIIPACAVCVALYALGFRRLSGVGTTVVSIIVGTVAGAAAIQPDDTASLVAVAGTGPVVTLSGAVTALLGGITVMACPHGWAGGNEGNRGRIVMTYPGIGGEESTGPERQSPPALGALPGYPRTDPQPAGQQPFPPQQFRQQPNQPYPGQPYPTALDATGPTQQQPLPGGYPVPPHNPLGYQDPGLITPLPVAPQPKSRKGLVLGVVIAMLVLAGGGVGTWFALSGTAPTGSATPEAAATKLMADLGKGDLLGVVGDLPPGEAAVFRDALTADVDQLKRLQVIDQNVNPNQLYATDIKTAGIKFDNSAEQHVNDHLTITKLTGGTITLTTDITSTPYTKAFLNSAFPNGVPSGKPVTLDITKAVRELHQPIGIATVKVGGSWYASLFYTITNAALDITHTQWPRTSIPAAGAGSADDAVRQFAEALLVNGDIKRAIELTSPDEMGALHDVGERIVDVTGGHLSPSGAHIESANFTDQNVPGGTEVVLQSMAVEANGRKVQLTHSGQCYLASQEGGEQQKFCASDVTKQLGGSSEHFPPEIIKFVQDITNGVMSHGFGVVATQVDGSWYVSPVRTFSQLVNDGMAAITPDDLAAILRLSSSGLPFGNGGH